MSKIRVLVIEDSLTVRKRLVEVLGADAGLEVVGEAADGQQGAELCRRLRPDVVTLDMMLPVMTGLAATEYIMAYCPTPILVVSASTNRGELLQTYDALAAGALDVLDKPLGDEPDDAWEKKFVATVKLISRIKVITHPRARLELARARFGGASGGTLAGAGATAPAPAPAITGAHASGSIAAVSSKPPGTRTATRAVAVGVSTGGPAALVTLLRALPVDFPLPIVVVIHVGQLFASAFVEWLDGQSPLRVTTARDGDALPAVGAPGVVVAPSGRHLVLRGGALRLTSDPELHSCRPAVDLLFASFAQELGASSAACLLTGMGRDGAEGLLAIRRAGGRTIAQDEASCVVFGMPKEAIAIGAAERILSLTEIAPALLAMAGRRT